MKRCPVQKQSIRGKTCQKYNNEDLNNMLKLNVVIVGCGAIAPVHAEAVKRSEFAQLYGACDIDKGRLNEFADRYGVKKFNGLEEVLNDGKVRVIHICTPHYLHKDMILQCISSGKDVVIEKPVAIAPDDLRELCWAAQNTQRSIMSVLQNRFNPCVQKMKEIADGFVMGNLLALKGGVCWKRDKNYYLRDDWRGKWLTEGGSLVINQAIHMLDMLDYLGGRAKAIKGSIDTRVLGDVIETEDTAEATLYFDNDVRGHFFATNTYAVCEPFEITLVFEKGTLRYLDKKLFDGNFNLIAEDIPIAAGKSYWGNSHKIIIDNFYSSLSGTPKPYPDMFDGLRATELVMGLYKSDETNTKYAMNF
jgi:UDP-N-acetyl-2-amino-2-deoxyglucuronate dehydrogenase